MWLIRWRGSPSGPRPVLGTARLRKHLPAYISYARTPDRATQKSSGSLTQCRRRDSFVRGREMRGGEHRCVACDAGGTDAQSRGDGPNFGGGFDGGRYRIENAEGRRSPEGRSPAAGGRRLDLRTSGRN